MLTDTHCHLDASYFPEGVDAVLARARAAGVGRFVVIGVGEDLRAARNAIALAELHDDIWATAGMHPHDASHWTDEIEKEIEALAAHPRLVALGEAGLDYHYMQSPKETQLEVFRRMIQSARRVQLPLVVHTREAAEDTLRIMRDEGARDAGGIIHCFSEDREFARKALDLGFYISFSGIVTFPKAKEIQDVAAWAPADRILVETDSPYLAPVPKRGKPCEPAYVAFTARRIAELRGISEAALAELTSANAERLLGLDEQDPHAIQ